jgi:hypothetical protein
MRIRWSVILPVAGLILFALVSYRSMSANHQDQDVPHKYYWWSSLRLDTDPQNKNPVLPAPCRDQKENCVGWKLQSPWVTPGWLDRLLVVAALPAFLAGAAVMISLSKLGVDEVLSFMVSMPILLVAWFYSVGWLIERWSQRRQMKNAPLKIV